MRRKGQKKPDGWEPLRAQIFGTQDRRLICAIRRLLKELNPLLFHRSTVFRQPGTVNIIFTNNRHITELNRRFLHRNRPTDVLAFPLALPQESPKQILWGEIYISREQARRQAKALGRKLRAELLFLVRHGLLHLAGFSHQEMNRLP